MHSINLALANSVLLLSTVSSSALPSPLNSTSNSLSQPADFGTLTTNNSHLQDLASPVLSSSPDCNIDYGRNLRYASCDNALAKISRATTLVTFGERDMGNWNVVLPRRYLSGKLSLHSSKFHHCSCLNLSTRNALRWETSYYC